MPATATDLETALQHCDAEPIRVPGRIQPGGALVAVSPDDFTIRYASENTKNVLGVACDALLGTDLEDLLPADVIHDLRNAMARAKGAISRIDIGRVTLSDRALRWAVSPSETRFIIEFEPLDLAEDLAASLADFPQVVARVNAIEDSQTFLEKLVRILAGLSRYDRVMAYRFDAEWNGEVIAEAKKPAWESYLGLRFPHWDIPATARAMMKAHPVRFVTDAGAPQIVVQGLSADPPPLDMTLAELRGVSDIHLQYLRNMGVTATLTMSIVVGDRLWGMISFHHGSPRLPSADMRQLLAALAPYVSAKLLGMMHAETLDFHEHVDRLVAQIETGTRADRSLLQETKLAIGLVSERFDVDAVVVGVDDETADIGPKADARKIAAIRARAQAAEDGIWFSDSLSRDLAGEVDASALRYHGALCLDNHAGSWIILFRRATSDAVQWAGAIDAQLVDVNGAARLQPRGSYSVYRELVKDRSNPWQHHDVRLLQGISSSIIAANQRASVVAAMRRQQDLVLDEMNHRVRNIITLVRSISRQAASHSTSIEGYTAALERRMNALAIAHDLGASQPKRTISLSKIIMLEAAPFSEARPDCVAIAGKDVGLLPDAAPIMALVIHELMTNAAKYGALSTPQGTIGVVLAPSDDGARLSWTELGGPTLTAPERRGFGTQLIEQAIPFELGGESSLKYNASGLMASILIPSHALGQLRDDEPGPERADDSAFAPSPAMTGALTNGTVLIVEDNYMIAVDMAATLNALGFADVELVSSTDKARDVLRQQNVICAVLDLNLGRDGTSVELAFDLETAGVPFFFVTGYGELAPLPDSLSGRIKQQKPVSSADLGHILQTLLPAMGHRP